MNEELTQGLEVTFDLSETSTNIKGKVCGKIGPVIIVELLTALKDYNYTHIYILDNQIKKQ